MKTDELEKILDEIAHTDDMSFTCPRCKDIVELDSPECGCGFANPVHQGSVDLKNINNHRWLK